MKNLLFSPYKIGNLELKNRFVRSATHNNTSNINGYPTSMTKSILEKLASNEIGLIITGASTIAKVKNYFYIFSDEYINPWKEITESVHQKGSKIAMQIQHPGRQTKIAVGYVEAIAPSAVPATDDTNVPREISIAEIEETIENFAQGCRRAKLAGFDAVQLHLAHGYLLSNFISPQANIRTDKYGGSTFNRTRIILEIVKRARKLVGIDYPIFVKQNFRDYLKGGLEPKEAIKIADFLCEAGINAIEISAGNAAVDCTPAMQRVKKETDEAYFKEYAVELKKHVDIPVILVGGLRSINIAESIIKSGTANFISMCRPLICKPDIIKCWKSGNTEKSMCISCNMCLKNLHESDAPASCVLTK